MWRVERSLGLSHSFSHYAFQSSWNFVVLVLSLSSSSDLDSAVKTVLVEK